MATRIEKIFRSNTVLAMNSILNEVTECVAILNSKRDISQKKVIDTLKAITKTVDKFFETESITDEELERVTRKGK